MPEDLEDVARRLREMEVQITNLDRRLYERPFHEARSVLEQLYISPKSLLLFATLVNVALFIGGTVYTGIQVDSIQKRYQDAAAKISEAKQKYDEAEKDYAVADSKLKSIQGLLSDARTRTDDLLADVEKKAKASANDIADIRGQSEQQLAALKKQSTITLTNISDFQTVTENAIKASATGVATKLEQEIKSNREAIEKKTNDVDALGLQVTGLSAQVQVKKLELAKIQKALEEQLTYAKSLNAELTNKIKAIARTDRVTVPVAYTISDFWLKLLVGLLFLLCPIPALLVQRRFFA